MGPIASPTSQEILDGLDELSLKGFLEIDQTPTSGTASLPTPDPGHAVFVVFNPEPTIHPSNQYNDDNRDAIQAPGAPLMRDMDSFTEGTGKGSFDSIPVASTDQYDQPIPRVDSLSLSLLPPIETFVNSVERWRENVVNSETTTGTVVVIPRPKRRRSASPSRGRNTRARALSMPLTFDWSPTVIDYPVSRADSDQGPRTEAPD